MRWRVFPWGGESLLRYKSNKGHDMCRAKPSNGDEEPLAGGRNKSQISSAGRQDRNVRAARFLPGADRVANPDGRETARAERGDPGAGRPPRSARPGGAAARTGSDHAAVRRGGAEYRGPDGVDRQGDGRAGRAVRGTGAVAPGRGRVSNLTRPPGDGGSERADVGRLRALLALGVFELHPRVPVEGAVPASGDGGEGAEHVRATAIGRDETEALV